MAKEAVPVRQTEAVKPRVSRRYVRRNHQGKPLVHCVLELLINSLSWHANIVRIVLNQNYFEILDNGDGLVGGPKGNRLSIFSVGESTADTTGGPGNFGIGAKDIYYSHMHDCKLATRPKDEHGKVFSSDFTLQEYDTTLDPDDPSLLTYSIDDPTKKNWPFMDEFRTGTWLRFNLKTRMAYGPERLAKAIAARVMSKYRDCGTITVNGMLLPERKIIGNYKGYDEVHVGLKQIEAEFVHIDPSDLVSEDDFRVGGRVIAEATFKSILKILDDDLIALVPPIYFMDEVRGSILIPYFEEYASPERDKVAPQKINEATGEVKWFSKDSRTIQFIQWLRLKAPEVQEALRIKITNAPSEASDEAEVAILRDMVNEIEDGDGGSRGKKQKPPTLPSPPGAPKSITLYTDRDEYEIGEEISATVRIRKDVQTTYSMKDVQFHTHQAHAKNIRRVEAGLIMTANDLGRGTLRASLPGSLYDTASYAVVMERQFKIDKSTKTMKVGETFTLSCLNTDKVTLPITWTLSGVGKLSSQGEEATYTSQEEGEAVIIATDSSHPQKKATCQILVTEPEDEDEFDPNIMIFEGVYFRYSFSDIDREFAEEKVHSDRPIQLDRSGSGTQKSPYGLVFHQKAFGYQQAREKGILPHFLLHAVCLALPKFLHCESFRKDTDIGTLRSEDWPALLKKFETEGYKLFEKIEEGKKPKKKK